MGACGSKDLAIALPIFEISLPIALQLLYQFFHLTITLQLLYQLLYQFLPYHRIGIVLRFPNVLWTSLDYTITYVQRAAL